MKRTIIFACTLLISNSIYAGSDTHWGYSGDQGASNWAKLSPDNYACSGKNQSPINLTGFIESDLTPIEFNYKSGGYETINNGHTIQVNYGKGSSLNIDSQTFKLLQFHFHAPSENQIDGKSYPLEAHFVHKNDDGKLAVIAVMFEEGSPNVGLDKIWPIIPKEIDGKSVFSKAISADEILPSNREYYRFNGSLTTPPCTEGVRWFVMKTAITASKEQISTFSQILKEPNNRPLQAINARPILQ